MNRTVSLPRALSLLLAVLLLAPAAYGSENRAADERSTHLELLDNFVHYTQVANVELAAANALALLEAVPEDKDLVLLLDEGRVTPERFDSAMSRAQLIPELQDIAGELESRIEQGRLDLARDRHRIEEAVTMLVGTQRQRLLAQRRLEAAGEYAIPELLRQITRGRNARLSLAAQDMIRNIGRQAVSPLAAALPDLPEATHQRVVCDLLGDIGYPHAAPALLELSLDNARPATVREAAARALRQVGPVHREMGLSAAYTQLAQRYFDGDESLIAFPFEPTNNIWRYDQVIGLTPTGVPTEVFGHVMAMKNTTRALRVNRDNAEALSLFVAANLKRESDLPRGAADPIYGESRYTPAFYATVFGTGTCLDVLAMAIDRRDTVLVRDAIDALSKTTGGANLFAVGNGRRPLLEAMDYPDRRVQYEAALILGRALPQDPFSGDYAVVTLLSSAIRAGGQLFALILADDEEDRTHLAARAEALGFSIAGSEGSVAGLRQAIDHAVGIDLVLVQMRRPEAAMASIDDLRIVPRTSVAPVMILAAAEDIPALRLAYRPDSRVAVSRPGLPEDTFRNAVDQLLERASGGRMSEAEAEVYAIEAISTLRDIAISGSQVYDVRDAEMALTEALRTRSGGLRLLVADILALIDSPRAQRELFDAALSAHENEQIELLGRIADSVKRHGNLSQDRHINALLDLVARASGRTAEAAAQVHGALNLPTSAAVRLIYEE